MAKVIILEGIDGSGKTTLAKELQNIGYEYKHEGVPHPGVDLIAHYLSVLDSSMGSEKNVVHDRLWLGERIYGPVMRNLDRLGPMGHTLFERLHRSKDITHILCHPPYEVALANYAKRKALKGEYIDSDNHFQQIYERYRSFVTNMDIVYDYTKHDSKALLTQLNLSKSTLPKGTVGHLSAKYLFIADRPNHDYIDVPFHAITGSSGYFNESLRLAFILERDLAISNAYSPKGVEHNLIPVVKLLRELQHIFIMGGKAAEWFFKYRGQINPLIKVHYIPHPSYLKRFKGHNPQILAEIITGALNGRIN